MMQKQHNHFINHHKKTHIILTINKRKVWRAKKRGRREGSCWKNEYQGDEFAARRILLCGTSEISIVDFYVHTYHAPRTHS
jgi:hypothetical protein